MALKNIEFFDVCVVHIANRLYHEFPRCIDMDIYEELDHKYFAKIEDFDERALILSHTLFWLSENGFLAFTQPEKRPSHSDEAYPIFMCVRLTAHGLLILKSPPTSIKRHESIGEGLGNALRNVVAEKATGMAVDIIVGIGSSLLK